MFGSKKAIYFLRLNKVSISPSVCLTISWLHLSHSSMMVDSSVLIQPLGINDGVEHHHQEWNTQGEEEPNINHLHIGGLW